jgi:predicted component of type VI protein secretion system
MQIILKPTSPLELDEIIVNDCLFAVGRHEPAFSTYDPRWTKQLSRRHARIFEQDGIVYLADLGSLNGTAVDGRRVGKTPVQLHCGDEICFAGLCYQIEILRAVPSRIVEERVSPPLRLVLRPDNPQLSLEPIVVTEFPFLISKTSDVFARYTKNGFRLSF